MRKITILPKQTTVMDTIVAMGIEKVGFLASSPEVAMLSKPTKA